MESKPKVIVILGPTASGKSALAVDLALRFKGEVISADSRQVYRGLDIGSGKITRKEMRGIPHHLIDVADPKKIFTADLFQKMSRAAIADILSRGKLPIICGGTGFYIKAAIDSAQLPDVQPNRALRMKLAQKTPEQLFAMLQKKDPARAKSIDPQNPVRLIRALEIVAEIGKVPPPTNDPPYEVLQIGIEAKPEDLKKKIAIRLKSRMKQGMVAEASRLHRKGLSWKRMEMLGLEYRSLARLLQKKISKEAMLEELETAIYQYSRRQMQWFRPDERIVWLPVSSPKIPRKIKAFLA